MRCRAMGIISASLLAVVALLAAPTVLVQAENMLTVHVIAHSHCDPGWLNTFEGYYTAEVRTVLDSVMRELVGHEHRKFVWSEISFFNRWYESLDKERKSQFQDLVRRGQIEFVNGGWVQNDEANPDPVSIINQMTTGHDYLLKNFGVAPKVAWQIDPFGHSGVSPSLFSLMGFDSLVINRIHHDLKDALKVRKQMEFLWRGADVGQNTDMFTHVLHTHYSAPPGFDWEEGAPPIGSNVGIRARDFANIMRQRASAYRTPHLLVPFGDDFKFKAADRQFGNMDRLMEHINANSDSLNMRVQYSTLSDYFQAVAATETKHSVMEGDFFPYADNEDSYWTGYYTTRPLLKQKSRQLSHILRACEQLLVLVRSSPHSNEDTQQRALPVTFWESQFKEVERARRETALFLHHDAITGTSRTNVVQDYQNRMDSASEQLTAIMARMIEHLLTKEPNAPPTLTHNPLVFGPPEVKEQTEVYHPIVYYNSLGWVRREVVSLRVSSRNVRILDSSDNEVACQVDAFWRSLDGGELAPADDRFTVSFVIEVPPLGASTYYVQIGSGALADATKVTHSLTRVFVPADRRTRGAAAFRSKYLTYELSDPSDQYIENAFLKVFYDAHTGLVRAVEQKQQGGKSFDFTQKFARYVTTRSGAYIFRPQAQPQPLPSNGEPATLRVTHGPIVSTVAVSVAGVDVVSQLFGGVDDPSPDESLSGHLAVTSTVSTTSNTELICSFQAANFPTHEREFFTNSGIDFQRRQSKDGTEAKNFYPMVLGARMVSRAQQRSFTVLTTHSMAVGSQADGHLQLMMHRWLAQDDGRGLAEPVQDSSRVEIPLWLSFTHGMSDASFRAKSIRLNNPLRAFYKLPSASNDAFLKHDHVNSPKQWAERQLTTIRPLKAPLPPSVHLLSLLARDSVSDDIVLRFQHLDSSADQTWVGSFSDLFESTYAVSEVRRATLSLAATTNMNGKRHRAVRFLANDDAPLSQYSSLAGAAGSQGAAASQNTDEEGVFLSQAALEKMRQDQLAQRGGHARRLLEELEVEPELEDVRASIEWGEVAPLPVAELEPSANATSRRLLSTAPVSTTPLFVVKPLQIQTYVMRLVGADWAEQIRGVQVGVGRTSQAGDVRVPVSPRSAPTVAGVDAGAARVPPASSVGGVSVSDWAASDPESRLRVGDGDAASNILRGHEHTVVPGRSRDAWRLIPSRWEYICVLLASLGGVAFFMQALRITARVGPAAAANKREAP